MHLVHLMAVDCVLVDVFLSYGLGLGSNLYRHDEPACDSMNSQAYVCA